MPICRQWTHAAMGRLYPDCRIRQKQDEREEEAASQIYLVIVNYCSFIDRKFVILQSESVDLQIF